MHFCIASAVPSTPPPPPPPSHLRAPARPIHCNARTQLRCQASSINTLKHSSRCPKPSILFCRGVVEVQCSQSMTMVHVCHGYTPSPRVPSCVAHSFSSADLGYAASESYGISYKARGLCKDQTNLDIYDDDNGLNVGVTGNIVNSILHHNVGRPFCLLGLQLFYTFVVYLVGGFFFLLHQSVLSRHQATVSLATHLGDIVKRNLSERKAATSNAYRRVNHGQY